MSLEEMSREARHQCRGDGQQYGATASPGHESSTKTTRKQMQVLLVAWHVRARQGVFGTQDSHFGGKSIGGC